MKNYGFTLFEVITVLSLIGIILAVCIPHIAADFGYMDKMSKEFLSDVRFIQMEAMKRPDPQYSLLVDSDKGKYYLRNNFSDIKVVSFKNRYSINYTGRGALYFTIEGIPVHPGTFTIADKKTNDSKSVTIVPATGRTIILE